MRTGDPACFQGVWARGGGLHPPCPELIERDSPSPSCIAGRAARPGPPTHPPAWAVPRRGDWTAHGMSQPLASHGAARPPRPTGTTASRRDAAITACRGTRQLRTTSPQFSASLATEPRSHERAYQERCGQCVSRSAGVPPTLSK